MAERVVISRARPSERLETREFSMIRQLSPAAVHGTQSPEFLKRIRQRAWETFLSMPMPSTTDEPWRRTDLRSMAAGSFRLPQQFDGKTPKSQKPPVRLLKPILADQHGGQIILSVNSSKIALDPKLAAQGVVFTDLRTAEKAHPVILEKVFGKIVPPEDGKFSALASALAYTGVLVYIPRGVQVMQPLHSILWGPGIDLAYLSHVLVWLDDEASLTYLHETASENEPAGQSMHAGNVEIHVGAGAQLRFVELQSWGDHVWNFSHERVQVEQDGNLEWTFGAIGSHVTKNFSEINLVGRGAVGKMSGFYFSNGTQHLDHDTQQNHLAPNTTSDLLFKGALRDKSYSVWQGMIYVAPEAQKTDGYQSNRNLILSREARADSLPGLEILADDVRCSHGATVGKIDKDQVFYLRSRGIPYRGAERLIVEGFFDPIMQRIPFEGVRNRFRAAIEEKMN
jgi:Fe-S cluster assembly protein SufD